jgi:hypothetical protein
MGHRNHSTTAVSASFEGRHVSCSKAYRSGMIAAVAGLHLQYSPEIVEEPRFNQV